MGRISGTIRDAIREAIKEDRRDKIKRECRKYPSVVECLYNPDGEYDIDEHLSRAEDGDGNLIIC